MVDGTVYKENDPERDRIIGEYQSGITPYIRTVIAIEDDITDQAFAEYFAEVHEKRAEIEKWFDSVKAPLNEALKKLNNKLHELVDPLKEIEDSITAARKGWFIKKRDEIDAANKRLVEDAGDQGVAVLNQQPHKTVVTSGGTAVGLRTQPSWRLTDDKSITAKVVEQKKMKFSRADPMLKNVPDEAFFMVVSMIAPLLKTNSMPSGPHSIEKFDDLVSTSR